MKWKVAKFRFKIKRIEKNPNRLMNLCSRKIKRMNDNEYRIYRWGKSPFQRRINLPRKSKDRLGVYLLFIFSVCCHCLLLVFFSRWVVAFSIHLQFISTKCSLKRAPRTWFHLREFAAKVIWDFFFTSRFSCKSHGVALSDTYSMLVYWCEQFDFIFVCNFCFSVRAGWTA